METTHLEQTKEVSINIVIASVISQLESISSLALKVFFDGNDVFTLLLIGLREFDLIG